MSEAKVELPGAPGRSPASSIGALNGGRVPLVAAEGEDGSGDLVIA